MSLNKQQLAIIHIAKKDRGFSDDSYRSALAQICGVTSSAELDHDGFLAMMGFFDFCGFKPADAKGANFGPRPGMAADPGSVERIHPSGLWRRRRVEQVAVAHLQAFLAAVRDEGHRAQGHHGLEGDEVSRCLISGARQGKTGRCRKVPPFRFRPTR
jgi:phage gp16-like protein